jgi:hypothetical protein
VAAGVGDDEPRGVLSGGDHEPSPQAFVQPHRPAAAFDSPSQQLGHTVGDRAPAPADARPQVGRAAVGRHEHHPPGPGLLLDRAQEGAHALDEELVRVRVARLVAHDGQQRPERHGFLAVDEGDEQAVEVTELVVDHGPGHADSPRDSLDRHGVEALGRDHLERRVEELALALLGRETGRACRRRGHAESVSRPPVRPLGEANVCRICNASVATVS